MKNKRFRSYFSMFMVINIVFEIVSPSLSLALTNGSVQPETLGFESAQSSEMVDLFTGDFKYNLPLLDVDGYPINICYKAGQNMDAESGWVGLGWSLSPGVLNRLVKGLPDDFNGEKIKSFMKIKPFINIGNGKQTSSWIGAGVSAQIDWINGNSLTPYNIQTVNLGLSFIHGTDDATIDTYNNYTGFGKDHDHDQHGTLSMHLGMNAISINGSIGKSVGYTNSTQNGYTSRDSHNKGIGLSFTKELPTGGSSIGVNYNNNEGTSTNSRSGLRIKSNTNSFQLSADYSVLDEETQINNKMLKYSEGGVGVGIGRSSTTFKTASSVAYTPKITRNNVGGGSSYADKYGFWGKATLGLWPPMAYNLNGGYLTGQKHFYNSNKVSEQVENSSYGYMYSQNADDNSIMDFNRYRDGVVMEETPNSSYASSMYDLFFASAQGMNSAFRPFRNDIGSYHDPECNSSSTYTHTSFEQGFGALYHKFKVNSSGNSQGKSGKWTTLLNNQYGPFNFKGRDNLMYRTSGSQQCDDANNLREYYFKQIGDMVANDQTYDASILNDNMIVPSLNQSNGECDATSAISSTIRKTKAKRTNYYKALTANEASQSGFEKTINLYDQNVFDINNSTRSVKTSTVSALNNISRTAKIVSVTSTTANLGPQLSEISMTNASGDRYVYGIPSYNLYKKEVVFNASSRVEPGYDQFQDGYFPKASGFSNSPLNISDPFQLIQYTSTELTNNLRGKDNLVKIDEMPANANSYLLTNIVSDDYLDITGNGPSYDDYGNYTKFNYFKSNDYEWREPYCFDQSLSIYNTRKGSISSNTCQAAFETGKIYDNLDDKGFYQYGVRENYYVHSIETKNFVAIFKTSPKYDGMGVTDEQGTMGTTCESIKLDAIELYSKSEIISKGGIANSTPIKIVNFQYDYSLCKGTFNSLYDAISNQYKGKLTLKRIFFSYGKSQKQRLSPYEFSYADNDHNSNNNDENNFDYDPRSIDRWGNYKPNSGSATGAVNGLNNIEYPYSEQDKPNADAYAAAWNLSEIKTPSGSHIKITYEADDYAYVQNEQAGMMLPIVDCGSSTPSSVTGSSSGLSGNIRDNSYLVIDLSKMYGGIKSTLSGSVALNIAKQSLFRLDKKLYYKCFTKLAGPSSSYLFNQDFFDYVPGYAEIEDVGLLPIYGGINTYTKVIQGVTNTFYKYAYIKLKKVEAFKSQPVNPICLAGWDYIRNNAPELAYPGSQPENIGNVSLSSDEVNAKLKEALNYSKIDYENGTNDSPNQRFYLQNFCTQIYLNKSFVRAYVPGKVKLGGGYRVKQILVDDNWNNMLNGLSNTTGINESNTIYGQKFSYTDSEYGSDLPVSSGVAFYEPLNGGDEISLRQPIDFSVEHQLAPNDHYYQESPLGAFSYPINQIGYSKVTVEQIADPNSSGSCAYAKTVTQFYTAKDFPIIDQTSEPERKYLEDKKSLDEFLQIPTAVKIFHLTQGNLLKFNDMHGKLKSVKTFSEKDIIKPVTSTEFFYKNEDAGNGTMNLVSNVSVMNNQNQTMLKNLGRDIDVTVDTYESITDANNYGKTKLFDCGLRVVPVLPFVVPDLSFARNHFDSKERYGVKVATISKIVQEFGILDKVVSFSHGSSVTKENLIWDENTGKVLLTKTTNGQSQPIYDFNYPGYWAFSELGHQYKRDGMRLYSPSTSNASPSYSASNLLDVSSGSIAPIAFTSSSDPLLQAGDEVIVYEYGTNIKVGDRFWVVKSPTVTVNAPFVLMDSKGLLLNTANFSSSGVSTSKDYIIEITRPINHNQLSATIGEVVSLTDPRTTTVSTATGAISYTSSTQQVISASALEYCATAGVYIDPSISTQNGTSIPDFNAQPDYWNPIIAGYYGTLRPTGVYKYLIERVYNSQPNVNTDGTFSNFCPYWVYDQTKNVFQKAQSAGCYTNTAYANFWNWKLQAKNNYYSPHGYLVQSSNEIGLPMSQRFGYNHTLKTLEANNANVDEVGFDSFEEYLPLYNSFSATTGSNSIIQNNDYLGFYRQSSNSNLSGTSSCPTFTNGNAHTGYTSLKFANSNTLTLNLAIDQYNVIQKRPKTIYSGDDNCNCTGQTGLDHLKNLSNLRLSFDNRYLISFWVKGATNATDFSGIVNFKVLQYSSTSASPITTTLVNTPTYKTEVINGWQKLEYEFTNTAVTAPSTVTVLNSQLKVILSSSSSSYFIDDFRIQPFNSSMNCYVYDANKMRLVATLDDSNFATYYEYDNQGVLVRKKIENKKAVYTVTENRNGNYSK